MGFVQVYGCTCDDGVVIGGVDDEEANYWGVALGRPGSYEWHADFAEKQAALAYATQLARHSGMTLADCTSSRLVLQ